MTRIVCPDCAAAYEVPPSAIPPGGRDVQCAACGHNWYQLWQPGTDAVQSDELNAATPASDAPVEAAPWASRFDGLMDDRAKVEPTAAPKSKAKLTAKTARIAAKPPQTQGAEAVPGGSARMRAALEQSAVFLAQIKEDVPTVGGFGESPQPSLMSITDPVAALHPRASRAVKEPQEVSTPDPTPPDAKSTGPTSTVAQPTDTTAPSPPAPEPTPPTPPSPAEPSSHAIGENGPPPVPRRLSVRHMAANLPILGDEEPEFELPVLPPRPIDPTVLAVLRSEAAVETQARRKDATQPLESQDELPLVPQPRRSASEVRARLARLQEAERKSEGDARWTKNADSPADPPEPDPVPPPVQMAAAGFPPLPPLAGVEENQPGPAAPQRLEGRDDEPYADVGQHRGQQPADQPQPDQKQADAVERRVRIAGLPAKVSSYELAAYQAQQQQRGFRIGFGIPVVAVCLGLMLYLTAPLVMERMPEAEPVLQVLVERGDQMQERLATGIIAAFDRLGPDDGS